MTKAEVKLLCEDDEMLQWWAMLLFAEIMEVGTGSYSEDDDVLVRYVRTKIKEFPQLVIQRATEKAKLRETGKGEA